MSKDNPLDQVRAVNSDGFAEAAAPLMAWLAKNQHPHMLAMVTADTGELVEMQFRFRTERFIED